jgi:hypothetical protein
MSRGIEVGAAVLVYDEKVRLVGTYAPGATRWALHFSEPVPVVVRESHVPWPRPRQPLRQGDREVYDPGWVQKRWIHYAPPSRALHPRMNHLTIV